MNDKKYNFKSYINNNGSSIPDPKPRLLSGEAVAGSASSVTLITSLSDGRQGKYGALFITNYRLTFIPITPTTEDELYQKNLLLGVYDVPLGAVESVYMTDGAARRRRLLPNAQVPPKVKGMQVVCKNMRVLTFTFEHLSQGRTVIIALVHHAYPINHDLLFAYEHKEPYYPTLPPDLNMFLRPNDWKRELERCKCPGWRISCINGVPDTFMANAGETLIVPSTVVDCTLVETARFFRSGRFPIWVWGRAEGAALLRSGELLAVDQADVKGSVYLEQIRGSHPERAHLKMLNVCGAGESRVAPLPPLPALHLSYRKLVELCTPTTAGGFSVQDSQYYSSLESCKWLRSVSSALSFSNEAAGYLTENVTVVLLEGEGMDYCAVVSSLTQLLLDSYYRTISGFQSLIQKEWMALGHPFCDRLGLLKPADPKQREAPVESTQPAPVFLLFLDCVWQLQRQFPTEFQFTETYLTTLWDCSHNQIFDTFLFNSPRDRALAVRDKKIVLRPLWDWGEQFSEQDQQLFYNPLFASNKVEPPKQRLSQASLQSSLKQTPGTHERLEPCTIVAGMEVWSQCYERWLTPLDGLGMGPAQYFVYNLAVIKDIHRLKEKRLQLNIISRHSNGEAASPEPLQRQAVPRFYPFSSIQVKKIPSKFNLDAMQASLIDASQILDSQSLLNAPD